MSTRGALFRTAFVIISYNRWGYPGRGDSRPLCCVTVGTWIGAQEARPCVLVFVDSTWEFPTILLLYTVLNLRKEGYTVRHPNPLTASEKEFPEACVGISSCPWEFSHRQLEELRRRVSGRVRRVGWRPCCCFSKQKEAKNIQHAVWTETSTPPVPLSATPACSSTQLGHALETSLGSGAEWFHVAIPERLGSK